MANSYTEYHWTNTNFIAAFPSFSFSISKPQTSNKFPKIISYKQKTDKEILYISPYQPTDSDHSLMYYMTRSKEEKGHYYRIYSSPGVLSFTCEKQTNKIKQHIFIYKSFGTQSPSKKTLLLATHVSAKTSHILTRKYVKFLKRNENNINT